MSSLAERERSSAFLQPSPVDREAGFPVIEELHNWVKDNPNLVQFSNKGVGADFVRKYPERYGGYWGGVLGEFQVFREIDFASVDFKAKGDFIMVGEKLTREASYGILRRVPVKVRARFGSSRGNALAVGYLTDGDGNWYMQRGRVRLSTDPVQWVMGKAIPVTDQMSRRHIEQVFRA